MHAPTLCALQQYLHRYCRLLIAPVVLLSCTVSIAADGVVVDYLTGNPVPAATVTLQCDRPRFIHGFETVRISTRVTDASGKYEFSPSDLSGCLLISLRPDKPGFRHLPLLHVASCPDFGVGECPQAYALSKNRTYAQRPSNI